MAAAIRSRRFLTPAQHHLNLKANPICKGRGASGPGGLSWQFTTSPDPLGRLYDLRIVQAPRRSPQVFVDAPDLRAIAGGRKLPHVYSQSPVSLCLYLPGTGEWEPWMLLDRTVVPWSILWLRYYEEWLFSDDWKGGGMHPPSRPASGRPSS
ncbi:hypothetical protein [Methylobacterium sp. E-045]|uniref:hypothetical protein n=1 Tax=Methylobacterium sp. E-045 TaxID=2836575 RepID=UPI001FB9DFC3|nr:hypothetical protein [Methylobacterium sp. E-045]MCJ2130987.1 hypothetical protein [Methylobacterium sp. E-045]